MYFATASYMYDDSEGWSSNTAVGHSTSFTPHFLLSLLQLPFSVELDLFLHCQLHPQGSRFGFQTMQIEGRTNFSEPCRGTSNITGLVTTVGTRGEYLTLKERSAAAGGEW